MATQVPATSVAPPLPWGGLSARIRASVTARRLVPTELALIATDLVYRAGLRLSANRMTYAVAAMDAVVGGTPAESDLTDLATRHVTARARAWELQWRPWALHRIPVEGLEHLATARAAGRGLIISISHLGPTTGWVVLGRLLGPVVMLSNDPIETAPPPGYWGYQLRHRRKLFQDAGIERVYAPGSSMVVYKLLAKGGTAMMSTDWPGDRRTTFLGRPADLADGTAQFAMKTGATVLPAVQLPRGRRWRLELRAPLDPKDFSDVAELHEALVAIHEESILSHPEHLENLEDFWPVFTRDGWLLR
jgi:lauroyl/myristoyl acyltransferase